MALIESLAAVLQFSSQQRASQLATQASSHPGHISSGPGSAASFVVEFVTALGPSPKIVIGASSGVDYPRRSSSKSRRHVNYHTAQEEMGLRCLDHFEGMNARITRLSCYSGGASWLERRCASCASPTAYETLQGSEARDALASINSRLISTYHLPS